MSILCMNVCVHIIYHMACVPYPCECVCMYSLSRICMYIFMYACVCDIADHTRRQCCELIRSADRQASFHTHTHIHMHILYIDTTIHTYTRQIILHFFTSSANIDYIFSISYCDIY